jgi:hypothetical protein
MLEQRRDCLICADGACAQHGLAAANQRRNLPPATMARVELRKRRRPKCLMQIRTVEQASRPL